MLEDERVALSFTPSTVRENPGVLPRDQETVNRRGSEADHVRLRPEPENAEKRKDFPGVATGGVSSVSSPSEGGAFEGGLVCLCRPRP